MLANWRNTIVNTRAFGRDPDAIIACSLVYMEEMRKAGLACAAKHFPGDGSEERDQHLVMGCNDLSAEKWEATGFAVTAPKDFYELEMENSHPRNKGVMMAKRSIEQFKKDYDLVLVVVSMKGYAEQNKVRVCYSIGHSFEIPWYEHEMPTVAVSLAYTNHLIDMIMMKTWINDYSPTREYIHALVEKLTGKSAFKGQFNDNVWCGRWETRL